MSLQTIQQALQDLPNESPGPSASQVKKLAKLIDSDLPLQAFLEQLLPQVCELFSAAAAVAWLRAQGSHSAVFGIQYRMDRINLSSPEQNKHERLVQLAWQQRQPMLVEPTDAQTRKSNSDNPTGRVLLFGPIMHMGEPIALLELVLQTAPGQLTQAQRKLYLHGVQLVAERVYGGLRNRKTLPVATIEQATEQVEKLTEEIGSLQQQIRRSIETKLLQFHGWAFGSLEENQRFAKMVHQLLDNHGLRVQCPECGHPAIFRCLRAGNAKLGVFVYDHYLESGRTFHGGPTTVPVLRVVNKPVRRSAVEVTEP